MIDLPLCRVTFWAARVVEWGDTYDHSPSCCRGRPADRTLMVEPDWKRPPALPAAQPTKMAAATARLQSMGADDGRG